MTRLKRHGDRLAPPAGFRGEGGDVGAQREATGAGEEEVESEHGAEFGPALRGVASLRNFCDCHGTVTVSLPSLWFT